MALKVTKRCNFCAKKLREDGTCQNPKCVNYTEEKPPEENTEEENTEE